MALGMKVFMRKFTQVAVVALCLLVVSIAAIGFATGSYKLHFRDSIAHQRHKPVAPALYMALLGELSIIAQRFAAVPSLELGSPR
jgi:hypothetical protein